METETVEDRIAVLLDNLEEKNQQYTDLMRLAVSDDYEFLVEMLQAVSPEILFRKDMKGRTALDWARLQNNQRSISLISQAMARALNAARKQRAGIVDSVEVVTKTSNGKLTEALAKAIEEKNADKILKLLTHSHLSRDVVADLENQIYFTDFTTRQGDTPLIRCAGLGFYDVVLELIEMGVDIEVANQYGQTALTWAALCGHAEVVRALLAKGADIFHQTREGRSCLHYACQYVKGRVVSVIFDYLFEKFSTFRVNKHPFTKYDPKRWTNYAEIMEEFTLVSK
jgi:ankyrin repeat protein